MNSTEPVPTIDDILERLQIDTIDYHAKDLYSTRRARALRSEARSQLQRICASERLDEYQHHMPCRRLKTVYSIPKKDLEARMAELQVQSTGEC